MKLFWIMSIFSVVIIFFVSFSTLATGRVVKYVEKVFLIIRQLFSPPIKIVFPILHFFSYFFSVEMMMMFCCCCTKNLMYCAKHAEMNKSTKGLLNGGWICESKQKQCSHGNSSQVDSFFLIQNEHHSSLHFTSLVKIQVTCLNSSDCLTYNIFPLPLLPFNSLNLLHSLWYFRSLTLSIFSSIQFIPSIIFQNMNLTWIIQTRS